MKKILVALTVPGLLLGGAAVAAAQDSDDTNTAGTPVLASNDAATVTATLVSDDAADDADEGDQEHAEGTPADHRRRMGAMKFAEALDMTGAEFREEIQSGKTVAEIAEAQGLDINVLIADMVGQAQDMVDENPDSPRAQNFDADALTEKLTAAVNGEFKPGDQGRMGRRGQGGRAVAEALGLEPSELKAALQSGSTIADIADEQGVDIDGLVDQIVAEAQARADANPDSPRAQNFDADTFEQRLTDRVNGDFEPNRREGRGPSLREHRGSGGETDGADA